MRISPPYHTPISEDHLLLAYVADLELEIDRLRKQGNFLRNSVGEEMINLRAELGSPSPTPTAVSNALQAIDRLKAVMQDLHDPPGYHPAHDQVIAIPARPLIEQVFRWQQRLSGASQAILHMELGTEVVTWFPARFRHILDNLISNALKYRDSAKGEVRVTVSLSHMTDTIELCVTDNGLGMPWDMQTEAFELFYRSAPVRTANLGVGLAVVKLLIEQSGGSVRVVSGEGKGSSFITVLPRYDVGDFLT